MTRIERVQLAVREAVVEAVTADVHHPDHPRGPAFLVVPGAGGDLDSKPLRAFADGLADEDHLVVRANLPYREAGRRSPPRAERSVADYCEVAASARRLVGQGGSDADGWVVGGKSYGGRVASLAVADGLAVRGLCFYGYPLHPPGRPEKLRVGHWPDIGVPCLFLQGTKDTFCDLDLLRANLHHLPRRARVEVVEGGDHSLKVSRAASPDAQARSAPEVLRRLAATVSAWARGID